MYPTFIGIGHQKLEEKKKNKTINPVNMVILFWPMEFRCTTKNCAHERKIGYFGVAMRNMISDNLRSTTTIHNDTIDKMSLPHHKIKC